jgi:dimethylaniline monooxygenase (N-oxide forming)
MFKSYIGANLLTGISGLVSLKECLAEGVDARIFEAQSHIGGQWVYQIPDPKTGEVWSSMYDGVILNSYRDATSFSDFPMDPARYPGHFGHRLHLQFVAEYAAHFDLNRYIQFNTKIVSCKQTEDGRWIVTYSENGSEPREEIYDAVFACTGHFATPKTPDFPGKNSFKGEFIHSHIYRIPSPYYGKRVGIIGIGSSAVDIACEIGPFAKEVHIITRRGSWIVPRYIFGKPPEAYDSMGINSSSILELI